MENSINYNPKALERFNKIMQEIAYVKEDMLNLHDVAMVCKEQKMTAIVTLTVLDNAKYEHLNELSERDYMLRKMNKDETPGNTYLIQPGFPGQVPKHPTREEMERHQMMEQNRNNAAISTFQVNTQNYPSVSLRIIKMLRDGLEKRKLELEEEAKEAYAQVIHK